MDQIERVTEGPFFFYIVHFELDVWWDPSSSQFSIPCQKGLKNENSHAWLCRAEVYT